MQASGPVYTHRQDKYWQVPLNVAEMLAGYLLYARGTIVEAKKQREIKQEHSQHSCAMLLHKASAKVHLNGL